VSVVFVDDWIILLKIVKHIL